VNPSEPKIEIAQGIMTASWRNTTQYYNKMVLCPYCATIY